MIADTLVRAWFVPTKAVGLAETSVQGAFINVLAFPASDQFVPLLALAVVCTHLVDTAAPMTA